MTAIRHRGAPLAARPTLVPPAARLEAPPRQEVADPGPIHRSILWGVVWMVVAGLATGITSVVAEGLAAGGSYVFWWGPLAYGASMVVLGLRDLRALRHGSVPERYVP